MRAAKLGLLLAVLGAGCAVYPPTRDTTQPDKIKKAMLRCDSAEADWATCANQPPAHWYFRPTVIDAPYEAWWTFVGEQGDNYRVVFEVTESTLLAYRANEAFKGSDFDQVTAPDYKAQPIAAWPIRSHFDVWYQYNPTTGEELPILYEAQERPWYQREYIRVDWSRNQIAGYGYFMGSKLTAVLDPQSLKVEPAATIANDPKDDDYRILTNDYVDVVNREVHTPMTVEGMDGSYFSAQPTAEVAYRYAFMRVKQSDYEPLYYPDPMFEKFGFFRHEREVYDRSRGPVDFKDYRMNRWNLWQKTHGTQTCKKHSDCTAGTAADGVTCDKFELYPDPTVKPEDKAGTCTLPYVQRGVKPIVYYLSPNFPEKYLQETCVLAHEWNVLYKKTVAALLNQSYTPPEFNEEFKRTCTLDSFKEPPAGTNFDPAAHDIFVLKDNAKNCNADGVPAPDGDRWCYRAGDLRYSMIYYVDQASSGSPLGYGPVASDPFTGEIIQGNAFIYGGALDSYSSYIKDVVTLTRGEIDETQFRLGENVRDYYQNLASVSFPPSVPQNNFRPAEGAEFVERFQGGESGNGKGGQERLEMMKRLGRGARQPFLDKLKGSWIEKMMIDNVEWKTAHGLEGDDTFGEAEMDAISPLRSAFWDRNDKYQRFENLMSDSKHCRYHTNEYTDATITYIVEKYVADHGEMSSDEITARIMNDVYRGVTEHEVGHNMGLRHNFEASFDADNYFPAYYPLRERADLRDPDPKSFSATNSLPLTPAEYELYDTAKVEKRRARDRQGIKLDQYSSIMDYGGQFYSDFRGLGRYDEAAIKFGYGQLVEVFDGSPDATRGNRLTRNYYMGGEACTVDADCAYNSVGQSCAPGKLNPAKRYCTSSDEDLARDADEFPAVKFRFCSDERATDRPFCNRFDEGASSSEIVENLIDSYDRNYVFNNFRRYRRFFGPAYGGRIWSRYFSMMGKQFASLLYQLYYNQSSVLTNGAGSFNDMLAASVKAMNFYTRVLTTPDVGAYRKTAIEQLPGGQQRYLYERFNRDCKANGADFEACLGVGKHFYSVWEQGYYGALDRQARAGIFTDKLYALIALTNREWGNPQANDETYPLSFYDGFPGEMLKLFSGLISQDITRYAPAVRINPATNKAQLQFRDVWSGSFFGTSAANFGAGDPIVEYPIDVDNDTRYEGADILDPEGRSPFIRFYALILSLQSWPDIFDQTYADYMQLYTFGGPEVRFPADCTPGSSTCQTVAYESPLRKKIYMAVQTPDQKSIIFPLVKQAFDLKTQYDRYFNMTPAQAVAEQVRANNLNVCSSQFTPDDDSCRLRLIEDLRDELTNRESFLNITDEVRKLLGLNL